MPDGKEEFLRPASLAPLLGVGVGRVYQLVAAGAIPVVRRGRSILVPRAAWEQWLEQQRDRALSAVCTYASTGDHD